MASVSSGDLMHVCHDLPCGDLSSAQRWSQRCPAVISYICAMTCPVLRKPEVRTLLLQIFPLSPVIWIHLWSQSTYLSTLIVLIGYRLLGIEAHNSSVLTSVGPGASCQTYRIDEVLTHTNRICLTGERGLNSCESVLFLQKLCCMNVIATIVFSATELIHFLHTDNCLCTGNGPILQPSQDQC